ESAMEQGREVILVSRFFEVAREVPAVSRIAFLRALDQSGGRVLPNHFVGRSANGSVVLRHYLTGREAVIDDIAAVVWVGGAVANGGLGEELEAHGLDRARIHVVGDAFQPRRLANALLEAHSAARAIS
ncbi:MAG: hypothetical protein JSS20_16465, partial [Proteobacteria bacterium]|nr:hypothetical protein [Pseudomonadota bacterium]